MPADSRGGSHLTSAAGGHGVRPPAPGSVFLDSSRLFIIGAFVSVAGSSLSNIALAYRFLLSTESGLEYAAMIYSATLASIVVGPFLGRWVDRQSDLRHTLFWSNIGMGAASILLAFLPGVAVASLVVFVSTLLAIAESAATFKLLPFVMDREQLTQTNLSLQQIHSFGFIFGPLVAPLFKRAVGTDTALFLVDGLTFFFAAWAFRRAFDGVPGAAGEPVPDGAEASGGLVSELREVFRDRALRKFFVALLPFSFAFSAMAFSLALVAKTASAGDEFLYSVPIVTMFAGRLLLLRMLRGRADMDYRRVFAYGLLGSAVFILPLSLIGPHLLPIACLEFVLGGAVAAARFAEGTYVQLAAPRQHLAKISAFKNALSVAAKAVSVPVVGLVISGGGQRFVTPLLATFFFIAFLHVWFNSRAEEAHGS